MNYKAVAPARADAGNGHTDRAIRRAYAVDAVEIGQMFRAER